MFSIVRILSFGATLIVPLVLFGCPPEGNEPSTGGTGGEPSEETSVERLCDRLDECNELTGISASECTDLTNFCVDENFATQSLKDDWATFVEDCLEFSTCSVFVGCALNVADATGCPPFTDGTGGSGGSGGEGGTGGTTGEGGAGGGGGVGAGGEGGSAGSGCDTNVPGDISSPVCSDCFVCAAAGPCLAQSNQCQTECLNWISCFNNCPDAECVATCNTQYPNGREQALDLWDCAYCEQCPTNCSFDEFCNPG